MSTDAPTPETWTPLPPHERRVLGVLVEKQKTSKTADAYPMTLNSLTTGCNQKSNRDPVLDLSDDEVEEAIDRLKPRGLVMKVVGGRTDRYRHLLYEAWRVSKTELAVLAELLLRGPQSEGDLRGRADRMSPIADLDELRQCLRPLAERKLIVYLTAPDRRGAMLTHGFHTPEEIEAAKARVAGIAVSDEPPAPRTSSGMEAKIAEAFAQIDELRKEVAALKKIVQGEPGA